MGPRIVAAAAEMKRKPRGDWSSIQLFGRLANMHHRRRVPCDATFPGDGPVFPIRGKEGIMSSSGVIASAPTQSRLHCTTIRC